LKKFTYDVKIDQKQIFADIAQEQHTSPILSRCCFTAAKKQRLRLFRAVRSSLLCHIRAG